MNIKEAICNDLDIPLSLVDEALDISRKQVKIFNIKKRNGSQRQILQPAKKVKTIQYWLIKNIFEKFELNSAASAFRNNMSILTNVRRHRENTFFLKIDLKNFFNSIEFDDLVPYLEEWKDTNDIHWELDGLAFDVIRKVCFYKGDILPVGFPSSPIISNIVMLNFDMEIKKIISNQDFNDVIYTRYADDMVFSTNRKGVCKQLKNLIYELVDSTETPNIKINFSKTKFGSSSGGTASVTGLKVCKSGHITIHRKQKDHIRLMLSLFAKGKLKKDGYESLMGHIAYCQHVAPLFFSSISKRYFREIEVLKQELKKARTNSPS